MFFFTVEEEGDGESEKTFTASHPVSFLHVSAGTGRG